MYELSSQAYVGTKKLTRQADYVLRKQLSPQQRQDIKNIIVSNNGSVLDESTFSQEALIYLIDQIKNYCPNVSVLTLETRPDFVRFKALNRVVSLLCTGPVKTSLEFAVGLEIFDEVLRNKLFNKGLSNLDFEKFASQVAGEGHRLRVYFQLKPVPQMTDQDAIDDVRNAVQYLAKISRREELQICLHLNPTFVAQGTQLEHCFANEEYLPPALELLPPAVLPAEGTNLTVYIGLDDEGLAVPKGSLDVPENTVAIDLISQFNITQDFKLLRKL